MIIRPKWTFGLHQIVHNMSHDDGRYWGYLALDLPMGTPGRPFVCRPAPFWFVHWANQQWWEAT